MCIGVITTRALSGLHSVSYQPQGWRGGSAEASYRGDDRPAAAALRGAWIIPAARLRVRPAHGTKLAGES